MANPDKAHAWKGLLLWVLRPAHNPAPGGGASDQVSWLILVATSWAGSTTLQRLPKPDRLFPPTTQAPPVVLVAGKQLGKPVYCLTPVDAVLAGRACDPSGNYATGDWRLAELTGFTGAIPIHDQQR